MFIFKSLNECIKNNYATFKGRTARRDYIVFSIFYEIMGCISILGERKFGLIPIIIILGVFSFILILPFISIHVRRLHDINFSGWWFLLATLIPFGIFIAAIILMFYPGTPGPNKYGEPPVE